jgi:prepilin-type N-terminal cleavage/methylation domain-containing protein
MIHTLTPTRIKPSGFTLLELSIVLIIIALVTGMSVVSGISVVANVRQTATQSKIAAIEQAMLANRITNDRIPCPASLTLLPTDPNYGVEAANPGSCTGGTPAATFTSPNGAAEGAVPTVTLGLPNDFMYDGWGSRFRYAVDKNTTNAGAFPTLSLAYGGTITVNDGFGNARSWDRQPRWQGCSGSTRRRRHGHRRYRSSCHPRSLWCPPGVTPK